MEDFYRIRRLPPYVFEQINRAKAAARNAGADIIDLGMGNPDLSTPPHVLEKLKETLGKPRTDRYSASRGITGLRRAQAASNLILKPRSLPRWVRRRGLPTLPRLSPRLETWCCAPIRAIRSMPSAS
jgi:hypothetical protein